jgi:hypothetical protein
MEPPKSTVEMQLQQKLKHEKRRQVRETGSGVIEQFGLPYQSYLPSETLERAIFP